MANKKSLPVIAFIGFFVLVALANSMFIVSQTEQALVLRFGKPVKLVGEPGLKFKKPFIEEVRTYEKRTLVYHDDPMTVILADQDRLIVDAFVTYKITNPLQYFEAAPNERNFNSNLRGILEKSLRDVMGKEKLTTLLSPKRSDIMKEIRLRVSRLAMGGTASTQKEATAQKQHGFGIEVVDVRIMRTDLPQETSAAIYNRMRSDRQKVAEKFRAEGQRESQIIRSEADKTRTIILAEAEKKSQTTRGEGEGTATKIFADSYGKDREFFDFYRTMQAYKESIGKDDTTMVLSPDSSFLKHMEK